MHAVVLCNLNAVSSIQYTLLPVVVLCGNTYFVVLLLLLLIEILVCGTGDAAIAKCGARAPSERNCLPMHGRFRDLSLEQSPSLASLAFGLGRRGAGYYRWGSE